MMLARALLAADRVRRDSWPDRVVVSASENHRVGTQPVYVNDTDCADAEPHGRRVYLTLKCVDSQGRIYPRKELSSGLVRPKQPALSFEITDWQPSIDDLFAEDWTSL